MGLDLPQNVNFKGKNWEVRTIEGIFQVIKKDSIERDDYNGESDYELVEVYAVRDDKNGYPHFLIYENGEWKYKSAKYFTTEVRDGSDL